MATLRPGGTRRDSRTRLVVGRYWLWLARGVPARPDRHSTHNVSSSTTNIPTTKKVASDRSPFLEGCAFDQFVDDFLPKVSGVIDHFTSGTAFRRSARAGCGGTVGGARQIAQAHDRTRRWEVSHGVLRNVGPDEHRSESRRVEPAVAPATQRVSSAQMVLPSGSIVVPQASASLATSARPRPPLSMWPGFRGCG